MGEVSGTLTEAQTRNETGPEHRCIGMTVGDPAGPFHAGDMRQLLRLGTTRVEFGVQILDDVILSSVNRRHNVSAVTRPPACQGTRHQGLLSHQPGCPGPAWRRTWGFRSAPCSTTSVPAGHGQIYPTLVVKGPSCTTSGWTANISRWGPKRPPRPIGDAPPGAEVGPGPAHQRDIPVPLIEREWIRVTSESWQRPV